MQPVEDDKEVKLETDESVTGRAKLNLLERKISGTGLEILTPDKLLINKTSNIISTNKSR